MSLKKQQQKHSSVILPRPIQSDRPRVNAPEGTTPDRCATTLTLLFAAPTQRPTVPRHPGSCRTTTRHDSKVTPTALLLPPMQGLVWHFRTVVAHAHSNGDTPASNADSNYLRTLRERACHTSSEASCLTPLIMSYAELISVSVALEVPRVPVALAENYGSARAPWHI